jgi:hypothetical protein
VIKECKAEDIASQDSESINTDIQDCEGDGLDIRILPYNKIVQCTY